MGHAPLSLKVLSFLLKSLLYNIVIRREIKSHFDTIHNLLLKSNWWGWYQCGNSSSIGVHKLPGWRKRNSRLQSRAVAMKVLLIIECNYIINLNLTSPFELSRIPMISFAVIFPPEFISRLLQSHLDFTIWSLEELQIRRKVKRKIVNGGFFFANFLLK